MPRECAFCDAKAKDTGEHVWSKWISKILPGKKRLRQLDAERKVIRQKLSNTIDWKAPVVCHPCNTRWMSDIIENKHAKPAMSDLILDKPGTLITQERANSIALFAFKTAVILDQLVTNREPFFERSVRHEFRKSLSVPRNVHMWLARSALTKRGEAGTLYHEGTTPEGGYIQTYACTFSAACLVLQVAAFRVHGIHSVIPKNHFVVTRFWPYLAEELVWPPVFSLRTIGEFDAFADRWLTVVATQGAPLSSKLSS